MISYITLNWLKNYKEMYFTESGVISSHWRLRNTFLSIDFVSLMSIYIYVNALK